ncbi:hypothetical protein [Candidatus Accumulibacter sp. ACC005]|uniref:hypothetical protein n=1 Tax=Candidatus Accumulibacter sp. ACC005 TaxID=2823331 RepID=UPI0025BCB95E|nr:hypothetical protein [Candidatus Accumulibacter sp. ACC005]
MTSNDDKRATSLPDWDLWRHMPSVALWQFCALSLDFDPDSLEVRPGGWMSPGGRLSFEPCSFPSDELAAMFDKRYRILDGQEYRTTGRDYDDVDLAVCAAWAIAVGWDIPAELRALAGASPESEQTTVRDDGHDDELASLFDPVRVEQLEAMFPDGGKWANYAGRAHRNGLKAARVGPGQFNPYLAACWWLTQGPGGWDLARCLRKLANNLPARSKDSKPLLTGEYD